MKRFFAILTLLATGVLVRADYAAVVMAESPNVFLRLGDTSGTNANDSTANNADGTYTGGFTLNQAGPISGDPGAVLLNGTSGYVDVGNPSAVQVTGQFTLKAWIYLNAWPTAGDQTQDTSYANVAGKGYNGTNEGYILRIQNVDANKKIYAGSYDGSDHGVLYDASSLALNTWYCVVARYDGTAWKLYINGAEVATSTNATGAISSTSNFIIGASTWGSPRRFFNGRIANVAVFPAALTAGEIDAIYDAGAGGGGALTSGTASVSATGSVTATVTATAATGGTSPYTYQWHRSTSNGFTPGGGTAVSGATSLTLNDTGLSTATTYYYKLVSTDSAAATVTSNQISLTTTGGALTSGTASVSATGSTTATVTSTAATGGTSPYTYQWHRSTSNGFTPGGGTAVSGATALTLNDTGLTASTTYYYKLVSADSAAATVTSNQLSLTTTAGGTAPTITGGAISTDGTQITVNFSESVTSATIDGFYFIVNGVHVAPSSVSGGGASRVFEIGKKWFPKNAAVTVSYDAAQGTVVDGSAEELATVSGVSVTNASTVTAGASQHIGGKISVFLHWGMNTFANQEWTDGTRAMSLFNPTDLDFAQWAQAAKSMGAESMIWTVMHHDGFKNWRSATGTYGLVQSPWGIANPSRDLVKEYADACRAAGLRVSIYYSIWNRKDGQTTASVIADLTELLTKYGTIDTIWTDGWGWNIGYTDVNYAAVYAAVKALQPNCQIVENNHQTTLSNTDVISKENFYDGMVDSANRLPVQFTQTIWGVPSGSPDQFVPGEWWFFHQPGTAGWTGVPIAASTVVANINLCLARRANYSLNVSPDTAGKITEVQLRRMADIGALLNSQQPSHYIIPSPALGGGINGSAILGMP